MRARARLWESLSCPELVATSLATGVPIPQLTNGAGLFLPEYSTNASPFLHAVSAGGRVPTYGRVEAAPTCNVVTGHRRAHIPNRRWW